MKNIGEVDTLDKRLLRLAERLYRSSARTLHPWERIPKKLNWDEKEKARWVRIAKLAYTAATGIKC